MSIKKSIFHIFSFLLALTFSASAVTPVHAAGILYVKPAGAGNCSSWANACALQTALTSAVSGDEIWVAAGTYKPTTGADRTATFQLKDGVALYGGFAGTETIRAQRDLATNVTILSGDIDNNDSQMPIVTDLTTVTGNITNSYSVVVAIGVGSSAELDGFTITAGNANGSWPYDGGGGMFTEPNISSIGGNPTLTNVIFSGNSAGNEGGGMNNNYTSPTLTNVTFSNNSATNLGGGMYNIGLDPTLTNVTFSNNSAYSGGGMFNWSSSPVLTNVTFSNNSANSGGGMYNFHYSSPTLTNVTFSGNSANYGGGMRNADDDPWQAQIRNTIFWGNIAPNGAQIYNSTSTPILSDSVVQGGYAGGTNIITNDPLLGALGDFGGYTQTIPLLSGSSAIDAGNDITCATTDQRNVARPQGANCDIGAFESVIYTLTINSHNGTVARNPNQAIYREGDVVQLTAIPNTGWSFANWTGGLTSNVNPDSVTIYGNTSVTANYTQNEYTLTIISPNGTVVKNPDQATYHEGDVVQLTASPNTDWSFANWTGGLTGTTNPGSVTIHGNTLVTANYTQIQCALFLPLILR